MPLTYVPLLQKQLELYTLPRGPERFQSYLKTMVNENGDDLALAPLVAMNPMGKAHCNTLLAEYLAFDAERLAEEVLAEFTADTLFRVSLVLVDDAMGGWTNRTDCEYKGRLGSRTRSNQTPWITAALWTSEPASPESVVETVRVAVRRTLYLAQHGSPKTLLALLQQEAATQTTFARLDPEELAYTHEILTPLLETPADNMPVVIPALFGDSAAANFGYPALGLSDNAGLALATQGSLV